MDKCIPVYTHKHTRTHSDNLTLAPVSPGVHSLAKLASQMGLAAKTAVPAAARLLSSVTQKDTRRDKSRHSVENKRNKTLKYKNREVMKMGEYRFCVYLYLLYV